MKPASPIHMRERDYFLQFKDAVDIWPPDNLELFDPEKVFEHVDERERGNWGAGPWRPERLTGQRGGYICREITRKDGAKPRESIVLRESIVRFPSAPLFGSQSKTSFQVHITPIHQHTLRLLTAVPGDERPKIKRLFLIFNGLNETDALGFYYDLAGWLIKKGNPDTGCLIVPSPAHLTRYPLIGKYAEKPLQRFISDPSDLFRQYLRCMVETQWLISTLVPVSHYPVTSGISLLNSDTAGGRCDPEALSTTIHEGWTRIFNYRKRQTDPGRDVKRDEILQSVNVIRDLIGWEASGTKIVEREKNHPLDSPQLHVIGYSLGGYLAQSVFFSWPYAIGSCTTLCSGGALNSLRLERIVHEEEWRAITHGLKYEIESGMLEGRIAGGPAGDRESICGIPVSYFVSHFQTFNDIFLQEPHGTYRHRVSEFAQRLFFVVGGNDPIVPTRSVLDTSPPDGINMIEIAKLSHFLARERGEWPEFWLPTITDIISSLSDHCEELLNTTILKNRWNDETTDSACGTWLKLPAKKSSSTDRRKDPRRRDSEPLDSDQIQRVLLDFVQELEEGNSFLLILRNQLPVTMMGPRVLHRRGTVPHYEDYEIQRYWERLQQQRKGMHDRTPTRVAIVLPGQLNQSFGEPLSILSFNHLPIVQEFPDDEQQKKIWTDFLNDWEETGALYRFDPEYPVDSSKERFSLESMIRKDTGTPDESWILNCLPDVWISFSGIAFAGLTPYSTDRDVILGMLSKNMEQIYSGRSHEKKNQEPTSDEKNTTDKFNEWLDKGFVQIIRVSPAQSSPRFLGERVLNPKTGIELLTHTVLALARSTPCTKAGDFAKGWPVKPASGARTTS